MARARAELPTREPAVFACYLGQLALALAPTSEADPIGILACLIAATSVHLGPHPHLRIGDDRHPLLTWPMLVGHTGLGRKGAAWSAAHRVIQAADDHFAHRNIHSGLTSGEGLAALFTDPDTPTDTTDPPPADQPATPGQPKDAAPPRTLSGRSGAGPRAAARLLPAGDYRLLDVEPEWGAVMSRMRREGNSLSATLRAAWEGGNLSTLTVTARLARTSHIGVLAHVTPDELKAKLKDSDLAGGTYNRFLPIAVACAQLLPGSTGAPADLVAHLGAELAGRLAGAARLGQVGMTDEGQAAWHRLYLEFGVATSDETGPVVQFTARAAPHCLRIAALYAALDTTHDATRDGTRDEGPGITPAHLDAAAALVRYAIDTARTVFTGADLARDTHRLAVFITDAGPAGRTKTEITNGPVFGKNAPRGRVDAALTALVSAGRVVATRRPTRGRPVEVYTATPGEETE